MGTGSGFPNAAGGSRGVRHRTDPRAYQWLTHTGLGYVSGVGIVCYDPRPRRSAYVHKGFDDSILY